MRKCCAGGCRSNYNKEVEKVRCFGFPPAEDKLRRKAWISALNVVIKESEITIHIGVCIKHWPEGFETYRKKGKNLPVHPPSIFKTAPSLSGQTVSQDRRVSKRKVDYDSRRQSAEKKSKDADKFEKWSEILKYAKKKKVLLFLNLRTGFT